jgi:hypothetical protein
MKAKPLPEPSQISFTTLEYGNTEVENMHNQNPLRVTNRQNLCILSKESPRKWMGGEGRAGENDSGSDGEGLSLAGKGTGSAAERD